MSTPQKFNVRVRRGFRHVVNFILEDTDYTLLDGDAPWLRRLKAGPQRDAIAALRFMREQAAREIEGATSPARPAPITASHGPGAALAKAQRGAAAPGPVDVPGQTTLADQLAGAATMKAAAAANGFLFTGAARGTR